MNDNYKLGIVSDCIQDVVDQTITVYLNFEGNPGIAPVQSFTFPNSKDDISRILGKLPIYTKFNEVDFTQLEGLRVKAKFKNDKCGKNVVDLAIDSQYYRDCTDYNEEVCSNDETF